MIVWTWITAHWTVITGVLAAIVSLITAIEKIRSLLKRNEPSAPIANQTNVFLPLSDETRGLAGSILVSGLAGGAGGLLLGHLDPSDKALLHVSDNDAANLEHPDLLIGDTVDLDQVDAVEEAVGFTSDLTSGF